MRSCEGKPEAPAAVGQSPPVCYRPHRSYSVNIRSYYSGQTINNELLRTFHAIVGEAFTELIHHYEADAGRVVGPT